MPGEASREWVPHSVGGGDFCNLQRESRLGGERDQPQATTAGPQEPKRRVSDSGCPTGALVPGRGGSHDCLKKAAQGCFGGRD